MKKFVTAITAIFVFSFLALAAEDATGTWKATMETPNGSIESTFVLKTDAGKVTGTISNDRMGTQQISNGTVDGEKIKFSVSSDFGVISYSGTVKGDSLMLTMTVGDGQFTLDLTGKRVKS